MQLCTVDLRAGQPCVVLIWWGQRWRIFAWSLANQDLQTDAGKQLRVKLTHVEVDNAPKSIHDIGTKDCNWTRRCKGDLRNGEVEARRWWRRRGCHSWGRRSGPVCQCIQKLSNQCCVDNKVHRLRWGGILGCKRCILPNCGYLGKYLLCTMEMYVATDLTGQSLTRGRLCTSCCMHNKHMQSFLLIAFSLNI